MTETVKKFVLTVFSNPAPGREEDYNKWYNDVHLGDVLRIPGFTGAQRFKLAAGGDAPHKYLAIYEFEAADPNTVLATLGARAGTADMVISEALDMGGIQMMPWGAVTDKISASK